MASENQPIKMSDFLPLFKKLKANWHLDETRSEDIIAEYFAICETVGFGRFTRAVDSIINVSDYKFFPTVAEFRAYIPKAEKKPLCGQCESGWKRVPDVEARRLYGDKNATAMIRCECRRGPGFQKSEQEGQEWRPNQ